MGIQNPETATMSEKRNIQYLLITPADTDEKVKGVIRDTLRESGLERVDTNDLLAPNSLPLSRAIQRLIERVDLIIADISGSNPNIMYEIGFAQGIGKMVLPIVRRDEKEIPHSLGPINYLVYDPEEPEGLRRYLRNWTVHYLPVSTKI